MHSTTDLVPALRILSVTCRPSTSPTKIHNPLQTQNQSSVYCLVHCSVSIRPPYTLQSATDQVPALLIIDSPLQTQYQSSALQSKAGPISVLRILYSPLQTQYQTSVHSTIHYRPSSNSPYILQSTESTVLVLRTFYNPLQTKYQSSVYSTVHYRLSSSPV